ncbi:hypothetical protein NONI108955_11140 [Nocardia ninae]|uniref:Uncharacterized protein n=1 Tax=Nocardia ninae NBRC 108245 TaxID=1210091 RepID=A0A511MMV2_9NOCA|nr:hypothetical protein [Nocardia ninae]GEM41945.1 hypothetical protein NN4_64640 [Nocardia ninae NBRC 108245]
MTEDEYTTRVLEQIAVFDEARPVFQEARGRMDRAVSEMRVLREQWREENPDVPIPKVTV